MAHFIALYSGQTLASAKLVAVSSESVLVHDFATRLLASSPVPEDPVAASIETGRRATLRLIQGDGDEPDA